MPSAHVLSPGPVFVLVYPLPSSPFPFLFQVMACVLLLPHTPPMKPFYSISQAGVGVMEIHLPLPPEHFLPLSSSHVGFPLNFCSLCGVCQSVYLTSVSVCSVCQYICFKSLLTLPLLLSFCPLFISATLLCSHFFFQYFLPGCQVVIHEHILL